VFLPERHSHATFVPKHISDTGRNVRRPYVSDERQQLNHHEDGDVGGRQCMCRYLLRRIYICAMPPRFKLDGRPILSAHLNVETAGSERKRPEI
jgi:hypothetical protein